MYNEENGVIVMKLKIMTYNIEHGLDYLLYKKTRVDNVNLDLSAEVIKCENADFICLNEVRGRGENPLYTNQAELMGEMTERYSYFSECIYFENNGPYGDALLSKFPAESYSVIDIPDPEIKDEDAYYETRKLFKAEFNPEKKITVFISHFGLAKSEQKNAVSVLLNELKKVDTPVIFMGDLNMQPDDEILKPVYEVLNEVYVSGGPKTYPSPEPCEKIDYIFVSRDIKVLSADTIEKVVSDHLPVVAEIEI